MTKLLPKARGLALVLAAAILGVFLVAVTPRIETAQAADLSAFDPGFIITDEVFFDSATMSESAIQSWIVAKDSDCVSYTANNTKYTCLKDFTMATTNKAYDADNCSAYTGKSSERASAIIAKVAKACGINPQVILVTLQKEQGFITGGARSSAIYRKAMGMGCPDTSVCNSAYYGFFNQVYKAAWQFKQYGVSNNFTFKEGRTITVRYHPSASCGGKAVYIRNEATAALYNYTPYQPNASALSAGYGIGDKCGSYGNRNFFNYFSDWFGNPANLIKNASFQKGMSNWASGSSGSITKAGYSDSSKAQSGTKYAGIKTSTAGRALQQTVSRAVKSGQVLTAGVWVRSSTDGTTIKGRLHVWTRGGSTETITVPFEVGAEWTYVTTDLAIEKSGHTGVYFAVHVDTVGQTLRVDSTILYVSSNQDPRGPLTVENTAVESGTNGGWVRSSKTAVKLAKAKTGGTVEGGYYLSTISTTAGSHVYQRVPRVTKVGQSYTAGMWVRAESTTVEYTGRLRLLAMGGSAESVTTEFTVGHDWTYITATLPIKNPDHESLRIYLHQDTAGKRLHFDAITLAPNLYTKDSSFESGLSALNTLPAGTTVSRIANPDFAAAGIDGKARDGVTLLKVDRTSTAVSYIRFDKDRTLSKGHSYTTTFWVKSAVEGAPQQGTVTLQARASDELLEETSATFTADDTWRRVSVTHTLTQAQLSRLRTTIRLDSASASILVDGVSIR
jgi:hypothetical protein